PSRSIRPRGNVSPAARRRPPPAKIGISSDICHQNPAPRSFFLGFAAWRRERLGFRHTWLSDRVKPHLTFPLHYPRSSTVRVWAPEGARGYEQCISPGEHSSPCWSRARLRRFSPPT